MTETQKKLRLEDTVQTDSLRAYNAIVEKREKDPIQPRVPLCGTYSGTYSEKHHIRPKCLFPESRDDEANIVRLLPQEHFLAHYHLWKHYRTTGNRKAEHLMCCAIMSMRKNLSNRRLSLFDIDVNLDSCAREYEEARSRMSELKSKPVLQYSLDGKFLRGFTSSLYAASAICLRDIPSRVKNAMRKTNRGIVFRGFAWTYGSPETAQETI